MQTTTNIDRLHEVFNAVQNPSNWKEAIDATVPQWFATAAEIREAVIFFTGSIPKIEACEVIARPHPSALVTMSVPALHVTAVGYYAAVGA
jgi:hypothetical protein